MKKFIRNLKKQKRKHQTTECKYPNYFKTIVQINFYVLFHCSCVSSQKSAVSRSFTSSVFEFQTHIASHFESVTSKVIKRLLYNTYLGCENIDINVYSLPFLIQGASIQLSPKCNFLHDFPCIYLFMLRSAC